MSNLDLDLSFIGNISSTFSRITEAPESDSLRFLNKYFLGTAYGDVYNILTLSTTP